MFRRRGFPLLFAACALLVLCARSAHGCSCGKQPTVLDSYEWADVVVVARAVSLEMAPKKGEARPADNEESEEIDESEEEEEQKSDEVKEEAKPAPVLDERAEERRRVVSTKMLVERVYKGSLKVGEEMVLAQGGGADCIYTFDGDDIGRSYLFYLKRLKDADFWIAGTCGRSRRVEYARDDLLYLNNLDRVRGKTRLSGTLDFARDGGPGVGGRLIRVVGADKKVHEVRTDAGGVYEIYDLPPGIYTVEPEVPQGWKVDDFWLTYSPSFVRGEGDDPRRAPSKIRVALEAGRHAGLNFHFEINNAVRGVISDPEGRPLNGVCLDLVPADGSKGAYLADCTETGGAFEIDEIPPGRYVLVVNDDGEVTSSEPFGTFYHPNALRREEATVFEIGVGDIIEGLRVVAPKVEETFTVEGVLLYSDGKPVANEPVVFEVENAVEDDPSNSRAQTDAKGRFSVKILKGKKGALHGDLYVYTGQFENCPRIESLIKQSGHDNTKLETPQVKIQADNNLYGVELKFPFPSCKKKALN